MSADGYENALRLLSQLNTAIESAKKLYQERDDLVMKLQEAGFKSAELNGMTYELKDNFADRNTAWRMAAVNRFEITVKAKK